MHSTNEIKIRSRIEWGESGPAERELKKRHKDRHERIERVGGEKGEVWRSMCSCSCMPPVGQTMPGSQGRSCGGSEC